MNQIATVNWLILLLSSNLTINFSPNALMHDDKLAITDRPSPRSSSDMTVVIYSENLIKITEHDHMFLTQEKHPR